MLGLSIRSVKATVGDILGGDKTGGNNNNVITKCEQVNRKSVYEITCKYCGKKFIS